MNQVLSERQGHTYPAPENEEGLYVGSNSSNWEVRRPQTGHVVEHSYFLPEMH